MSSGLGFGPRGVASRLQALGAKWLLWCSTPLLSHGGGAAAGLRELYAADCWRVRRRRPDLRAFIFCPSFGLEGVSGWGWLCLWYMVHCMVRWNIKGGAREQSHAHDTPPPTPQPRAPTPVTASAHARVQ